MFGWRKNKKRKNPQPILTLFSADMGVIYQGPLNAFPFPENVILALSEEFFNDPSPCEIHRRAVQMRLCGEIMSMLPSGKTLSINEADPRIGRYCQGMNTAYVRLDQT